MLVKNPEIIERAGAVLSRSLFIPSGGFFEVPGDAILSGAVDITQSHESIRLILLCGFLVPLERQRQVLGDAFSLRTNPPYCKLRYFVALFGTLEVPFSRLLIILLETQSLCIGGGEICLRIGIAFFCCLTEILGSLDGILRNSFSFCS